MTKYVHRGECISKYATVCQYMPDMPKKPKTGSYYSSSYLYILICTKVFRAGLCGIYLYLHHQQPTNITAARLGNKQEVAEKSS